MNRWLKLALPWVVKRELRNFRRQSMRSQGVAALGGLGLGAALMYWLDPDRGRRRRALLRDSLVHAQYVLQHAAGKTSRDAGHRAYGLWAESRHLFEHDEPTDEVLEARVRAKLGRAVSHPHAIEVLAVEGIVTLRGDILAAERDDALACVKKVRGVQILQNQLHIHPTAGEVPSLQGGRQRRGAAFEWNQTHWSPPARLLAGLAGGALMGACLKRRDAFGVMIGTAGFGLLTCSLANQPLTNLIGAGPDGNAIEVKKTLNLHAPIGQVFEFWNDYRNFPRFLSNVREVTPLDGHGRSHWTVAGPAGVPIEWTAEVTRFVRNEVLAWRTAPDSTLHNEGEIHFEPTNGGTRIHIRLRYHPPGGALGHALARLFGADPKSEMDADLVRMKTLLETGHAPRHAVQSEHAPAERALVRAGAGN